MAYDAIELIPAPNAFFDRDSSTAEAPTVPSTEMLLNIVYLQRAAFYERQLVEVYRRIRYGGVPGRTEHPTSLVSFPNQELLIVYDSTLDKQLLQIYTYFGWQGIEDAQKSMVAASKNPTSGRLHPWKLVMSFFDFTRNRLALSIQDELVAIEKACADHVVNQVSQTAVVVNKSWATLAFEETDLNAEGQRERGSRPSLDTPVAEYKKFWKVGNRGLARQLYDTLDRAIRAQEDTRWQVAKRDRLRAAVQNYGDGAAPTGTISDLEDQERVVEENLIGVEQLYQDVERLAPLATLLIPMLSAPFKPAEAEHLLGVALAHFRGEGERIARAINQGQNHLRALFGNWDATKPLEAYLPDATSVESQVVKLAMARAVDQPMHLPMLSEAAMDAIVASGRIPIDSFTYVVWAHYKLALMKALAQERETEASIQGVVLLVNRLASLLSLGLWFLPAARGARLVAAFMGIGLLAYQAYSVVHTLRMLERDIDLATVELEAENASQVKRFGEILSMPGKYLVESQVVFAELALIIASNAFDTLKQLLHIRAYLLDIETLVEG